MFVSKGKQQCDLGLENIITTFKEMCEVYLNSFIQPNLFAELKYTDLSLLIYVSSLDCTANVSLQAY